MIPQLRFGMGAARQNERYDDMRGPRRWWSIDHGDSGEWSESEEPGTRQGWSEKLGNEGGGGEGSERGRIEGAME
eukprot:6367287-Pyramimonas_sp.AAC.1